MQKTTAKVLSTYIFIHCGKIFFICEVYNKGFYIKCSLNDHHCLFTQERNLLVIEPVTRFFFLLNLILIGIIVCDLERSVTYVIYIGYLIKDFSMQKGFTEKSDMIAPFIIHPGEKPFVSEAWNNGFACNTDLIKHRRSHDGDEFYICSVYNERFFQKCTLNVHYCI